MFERCIKCERIGRDCVPNLIALPWPELLDWWKRRQAHLGWTNQVLFEKSNVPTGTINRIKSGEDDARYSTMRLIIHALMGGSCTEFMCQEKFEQEFAHIETLEKRCGELISANEALAEQTKTMESTHREEIAALKAEYKERIDFLKDNNVFLRKQFEWLQERDRKEQTNREKG